MAIINETYLNKITQGDTLEEMRKLTDKSVDMILCDLPYGTTACKWDTIIPFEPLWAEYERVIKGNGAIVLTASQPFTTALIASNMGNFKYCWVWDKKSISNPQLAKIQPLKSHEDVCVFGKGKLNYYPQGLQDFSRKRKKDTSELGHCVRKEYEQLKTGYPKSVINFSVERGLHPTQKPVALFEYLIHTYTNAGEVVLDNCIGSGTTAVAAINTGRQFIGIEREPEYVAIANQRITDAIRAVS